MKRKITLLLLAFVMTFSSVVAVSAEKIENEDEIVLSAPVEMGKENTDEEKASEDKINEDTIVENKPDVLTSDKFSLDIDVLNPNGTIIPSILRFNIFTEDGEWLLNRFTEISEPGRITIEFPLKEYKIGTKFKLVATTGIDYLNYYDYELPLGKEFLVETYAYRDENGQLIISDSGHIAVCPKNTNSPIVLGETWEQDAENFVNGDKILSDTDYLIWVSKANYAVSVFLRDNGSWDCIKVFKCSIGAPDTPTVTGQYTYHQYQNKWQYSGYYVGPIMRFYHGYALHSTLINNDGTDRDGRVGKMISHGCVRLRPDDINWLVYYVPIGTKVYITEE